MSTHRKSNFERAVGEDMVRTPDGSQQRVPQLQPIETQTREDASASDRPGWFEPESQEAWP